MGIKGCHEGIDKDGQRKGRGVGDEDGGWGRDKEKKR